MAKMQAIPLWTCAHQSLYQLFYAIPSELLFLSKFIAFVISLDDEAFFMTRSRHFPGFPNSPQSAKRGNRHLLNEATFTKTGLKNCFIFIGRFPFGCQKVLVLPLTTLHDWSKK